jgi:hypothetical protein
MHGHSGTQSTRGSNREHAHTRTHTTRRRPGRTRVHTHMRSTARRPFTLPPLGNTPFARRRENEQGAGSGRAGGQHFSSSEDPRPPVGHAPPTWYRSTGAPPLSGATQDSARVSGANAIPAGSTGPGGTGGVNTGAHHGLHGLHPTPLSLLTRNANACERNNIKEGDRGRGGGGGGGGGGHAETARGGGAGAGVAETEGRLTR